MANKLEILLVEDDLNDCEEITRAVDDNPDDFTLIGVTNNSERAFQHVQDSKPDAVILDLELHNGKGDGIEFLKKLKDARLARTPYILVTTNNISAVTHNIAREYGADYIMTKNKEDYSARTVLGFLKSIKSVIQNSRPRTNANTEVDETPTEKAKRIRRRICAELDKIGISPQAVGRQYLVDAITMAIKGPVSRVSLTIGKNCKKTEASVERAMQNAIDRAWKNSDIDVLDANYTAIIKSDRGVPTVTEFIHYYARQIGLDY